MSLFLVKYQYSDDPDAQAVIRPSHREWLRSLGPILVGSGPTDDNGAALVFEGKTAAEIGTLLDADPFATAGFIAARTIVEWTVLLGRWAENPS